MPELSYESLRIRAHLQVGVISDAFLPLDGILYYHLVRDRLGPQDLTRPGEHVRKESTGVRLPFKRLNNHTREYYYSCSFAQWPAHTVEAKDHWSCRFDAQYSDLVDFQGKRGKVSQSSGRYKGHRMPVFYRHALYVEWYALGDRAAIERLLPFVTHLGKKPAQGWGSVLRWEVTPWPEDWSVRGPGGRLMRAVPNPKAAIRYGLRPSYWSPRHQFRCDLPDLRAA